MPFKNRRLEAATIVTRMSDLRVIPSIEQLRQRDAMRALETPLRPRGAARRAARARPARAPRAARHRGARRGGHGRRGGRRRSSGAPRRGCARRCGPSLRPRHQRDRRHPAHEPRPRAALARRRSHGCGEIAGGYTQPRIRPRAGRARPPRRRTPNGCSRGSPAPKRAVVVNNNAAATLLVLAALATGREVDHLARRAGRDRRRLPRARRDGAVGRDPARGRHDQPDARRRLRRGDQRADGADPARASVELPHRGLHRAAVARASSSRSAARFDIPVAEDLGSGWLGWPERDRHARRRCATSRSSRTASPQGADVVLLQRRQAARRAAGRHHRRTAALLERIRRHPLMRALRVDKLTYAALEATLEELRDRPRRRRAGPADAELTPAEIEPRAPSACTQRSSTRAGPRPSSTACPRSAAAAPRARSCPRAWSQLDRHGTDGAGDRAAAPRASTRPSSRASRTVTSCST